MRASTTTAVLGVVVTASLLSGCKHAGATAPGRPSRGVLLWARTYGGRQPHGNQAVAAAVSPSGSTVFVTGYSDAAGALAHGVKDYATVAYSAATGARLWVSRYNGPANGGDFGYAIAVSPTGNAVFVTGSSDGGVTRPDYATVAYNSATGAKLWVSRYNGPASGHDDAHSLAVSPDGRVVFVTGQDVGKSASGGNETSYATVAYNAATGAQLWVSRYRSPGSGDDDASAVAVSPNGRMVYVTGRSTAGRQPSVVTLAYRAATGAVVWKRQDGHASLDEPPSLAVSPAGKTVFVIGAANGEATAAYNATTGALMWQRGARSGSALAVAVNPAGTMVFIAGCGGGGLSAGSEYTTRAYDAVTGAQAWVHHYANNRVRYACARAVGVSPSGATVYVTGTSGQSSFETIAYGARTGRQIWARRYFMSSKDWAYAEGIAVSPTSGSVYVTGGVSETAYLTIGYRG